MSDDVSDFLAHYGIPGMKWGHTKSKAELKELDRKTRATPKEAHTSAAVPKYGKERDEAIRTARNELGQKYQNTKAAKYQFKTDKYEIGKVAAKRVLDKSRNEYYDTWNTAQLKTQREQVADLVQGIFKLAVS